MKEQSVTTLIGLFRNVVDLFGLAFGANNEFVRIALESSKSWFAANPTKQAKFINYHTGYLTACADEIPTTAEEVCVDLEMCVKSTLRYSFPYKSVTHDVIHKSRCEYALSLDPKNELLRSYVKAMNGKSSDQWMIRKIIAPAATALANNKLPCTKLFVIHADKAMLGEASIYSQSFVSRIPAKSFYEAEPRMFRYMTVFLQKKIVISYTQAALTDETKTPALGYVIPHNKEIREKVLTVFAQLGYEIHDLTAPKIQEERGPNKRNVAGKTSKTSPRKTGYPTLISLCDSVNRIWGSIQECRTYPEYRTNPQPEFYVVIPAKDYKWSLAQLTSGSSEKFVQAYGHRGVVVNNSRSADVACSQGAIPICDFIKKEFFDNLSDNEAAFAWACRNKLDNYDLLRNDVIRAHFKLNHEFVIPQADQAAWDIIEDTAIYRISSQEISQFFPTKTFPANYAKALSWAKECTALRFIKHHVLLDALTDTNPATRVFAETFLAYLLEQTS